MNIARATFKSVQIVVALAVLIVIIMWMSGMFKSKIDPGRADLNMPTAPPDAPTAVVEQISMPIIEEASGSVQARRKTMVSSRIMASIQDVRVSAGDVVEAGDTLIALDSRDLQAQLEEAGRRVEGAAAALQKAENDYTRAQQLLRQDVIGKSEFDQSESAYRVAQAALEAANKAREQAEIALSFTEITAPVSGRIVDRYAEPGDTASPGQPLLSLYDPDSLRLEAPVRESLLANLKVGDAVEARLGEGAETLQGRIGEIVPQAEAGSRTFLVKVDLPSAEGLYTGMFGRLLIPAGRRQRLAIPEAAIERIGQLTFVNVVGEGGVITRRLASLGGSMGDGLVEALSGLSAGEIVLLPTTSNMSGA